MRLFDAFCNPPTEPVSSGSRMETVYQVMVDKNGHKSLYKTGEKDVYDVIQQNAVGVDLASIVKRCQLLNDPTLLEQRMPVSYSDLTEIPSDLMELQNTILRVKDTFNGLPVDVRTQFKDFDDYLSSVGTDRFGKIMFPRPVEPKLEKEVIADDVKA